MNRSYSLLLVTLLTFAALNAHAQTTAIVDATVHTVGPAGTIENATILIEEGVITAVGSGVAAPRDATVIDAAGKIVTPGLFTPYGQLGLVEVGSSAGPPDSVQRGDQFTASFDIADAVNPRSTLFAVNRIEGVTRALAAPQARGADEMTSHVISGLAAIINLSGDSNPVDKRSAAMVVNLGEGGVGLAGDSRAANLLVLRNALEEAADYRTNRAAFERGQRRVYHFSVPDLNALQDVLTGDVPILANVDRASDIEALLRLAAEYDVRVIVHGGTEAWMVAEQLAAERIPVLMAPTANLPGNFDRLNARRDAAQILTDAGVEVGFAGPQSQTHNARNITQAAGNAVSEGLDWDAALRAVTLAPARIFGVGDRLGSIEPGKEADIVIWPADPLELTSYPERVFIRGVDVPMVSRQTLLRDRYLSDDTTRPPAFRQ